MLAVVLGYCEKKLVLYWIVDHSPASVWYQNLSSIVDAGQSITTPNSRVLHHFAQTYVTNVTHFALLVEREVNGQGARCGVSPPSSIAAGRSGTGMRLLGLVRLRERTKL